MPTDIPVRFNLARYLLDERVREGRGDRIALVTNQGSLTYRQVQERAHRFGHALREAGVRPEERVLIALPDGPAFAAALFGILEIGAVVVMVNPDLPPETVRYFLDYTRAVAVVADRNSAPSYRELAGEAPHLRSLMEVGSPEWEGALAVAPDRIETFPSHRDDAAIWLFSGGTTGHPKAVVQPHRSFANTTKLYGQGVLGLTEDDVTLAVPKLYFGYATGANLFFPFSVGGRAVLFPERCTAEAIFQAIHRHRPTVLVNVPTMIRHMVEHPEAKAQDLSCLRLTTSAGEALPPELDARWRDLFGVELLDGLGTAEMWHIFLSNRPGDVRPGTLGRAVPGFELRLCDAQGEEVPTGEVGALRVRGDSLGHGYWQQAEKTRTAFQGEWFVSEDLLRQEEDGRYVYCGRRDDMLKVSGKWLAPGELENCLLQHPSVRDVVVVGVANADGLVKPHAFVVSEHPSEALGEELQAFAREHLEPYKYPREVVFMDALPRTHLGKVDRGRLARGEPV
jgi:benzoate-CoA ligase family protein